MKYLKGFGKNYFTFCSMTMHSTAKKLHDIEIAHKNFIHKIFTTDKEEEESPPDEEILALVKNCRVNFKPCHCDCIFRIKAKLAIFIFKFIPRCPYYTTYFAYRRTGVHPPY